MEIMTCVIAIVSIVQTILFIDAFINFARLRKEIHGKDRHLFDVLNEALDTNVAMREDVMKAKEDHRKYLRNDILALYEITKKDSWIDMQNAVKNLINKKDMQIEDSYRK